MEGIKQQAIQLIQSLPDGATIDNHGGVIF